jgi:hypothetical protein
MRVVFCKYRKKLYTGNWLTCLTWATDIACKKRLVIPVHIARPDLKEARLVAEVSAEGIRLIHGDHYARIFKGAKWESL